MSSAPAQAGSGPKRSTKVVRNGSVKSIHPAGSGSGAASGVGAGAGAAAVGGASAGVGLSGAGVSTVSAAGAPGAAEAPRKTAGSERRSMANIPIPAADAPCSMRDVDGAFTFPLAPALNVPAQISGPGGGVCEDSGTFAKVPLHPKYGMFGEIDTYN